MPVTISIKNVPDDLADRLRERAKRHHRSLQGEVMSILEEVEDKPKEVAGKPKLTLNQFLAEMKGKDFHTPSESTEIIRRERDERSRR
jgi:plasmid stability protein